MGRKPINDEAMSAAERQRRRRERLRRERIKADFEDLKRNFSWLGGPTRPTANRKLAKLAKLCGMLGSNQAGERASAALAATAELKKLGLTWAQAFGVE